MCFAPDTASDTAEATDVIYLGRGFKTHHAMCARDAWERVGSDNTETLRRRIGPASPGQEDIQDAVLCPDLG